MIDVESFNLTAKEECLFKLPFVNPVIKFYNLLG